jgi:hypothetical protein
MAILSIVLAGAPPARAVEAVNVRTDASAIDLTAAVERHTTEADRILVSTAPGPDGIVQRMDVRAREGNTNWAVFALANSGDEQIDRLIVIPHYRLVGSGLLWPDLGLSRVVTITSSGERPDRQESATADVFRITLDPGAVMTYVAELRTNKLTQIYLWEPDAYKDKVNSITLYHGIVIGIAGLLALFLTILFVVKGSVMFPAAAALGWAVLVYIGIDFGFWGKVFDMSAGLYWRLEEGGLLWGMSNPAETPGESTGIDWDHLRLMEERLHGFSKRFLFRDGSVLSSHVDRRIGRRRRFLAVGIPARDKDCHRQGDDRHIESAARNRASACHLRCEYCVAGYSKTVRRSFRAVARGRRPGRAVLHLLMLAKRIFGRHQSGGKIAWAL